MERIKKWNQFTPRDLDASTTLEESLIEANSPTVTLPLEVTHKMFEIHPVKL